MALTARISLSKWLDSPCFPNSHLPSTGSTIYHQCSSYQYDVFRSRIYQRIKAQVLMYSETSSILPAKRQVKKHALLWKSGKIKRTNRQRAMPKEIYTRMTKD